MRAPQEKIIGRQAEKESISKSVENASENLGQIILISGEAGIGKSTLVEHLKSESAGRQLKICLGECTKQDASTPYIGFQRALGELTDESLFKLEEQTFFDEVFLISKIGLLISHVSRSEGTGIDEDILGSMLTAVQDFVKDSFGDTGDESKKGGLGKLEYLNTKIFIEHGDLVFLAVVTSGEEHPDMKRDIRRCVATIEEKYFDLLVDWDGDLDALSGSVGLLQNLADSKYRVKRNMDNVNISSERLKVQNRIFELVQEHASESGMALVLEDIHWADESTLLALPFIARNIVDAGVVLCLTYRPDEIEDGSGTKEIIDDLASGPNCIDISLANLDESSLDTLVKMTLEDGEPPEELMTSIRAETQGNPFFVIEAVRALQTEGTLYKDKDIWVLKHRTKSVIPSSVVELVSRRLETLDIDCLRLVEYGAVLGRRFQQSFLESGFRLNLEHVRDTIDQLVAMNFLHRSGSDDLIFQHSKIQEVIYSGMSMRWKRVLHKNAGQMYEDVYRHSKDEVLFSLAYHFSRTLEFEKGIEYCISAGYKARDNFAPREASQFIETAIELIDVSEREEDRYLGLNEMLGELYELDGNYQKALDLFEKIAIIPKEPSHDAAIQMMKGRILQAQSKYDDAIAAYEQGINLADKADSILLKAKINGYLGKIYLRKGQYEKALELQRNYLVESQKSSDSREIGQAYMNLGGVYYHLNDYNLAINNWSLSLEHFHKANYMQGIAFVNDNLGVGHLWLGNFTEAQEHYRKSEEIMAKVGDVKGLSMVLNNLGVLLDDLGDYDKALEYYQRSMQMKKRIGDVVGVANIYNNVGSAHFNLGDYEKALENYRENLHLMERSGDTWGTAQALNNIAEAEIELCRFDDARDHTEKALELASEHSFKEVLSDVNRSLGLLASHDGDLDRAIDHLETGLELAKEIEEPQKVGTVFFYMARVLRDHGLKDKAVDNYANALEVFDEANMMGMSKKVRLEMQLLIDKE